MSLRSSFRFGRVVGVLLAGASLVGAVAGQESRQRAEAQLGQALAQFASDGDMARAAQAMTGIAAADPTFVAPRRNLARIAEARNDWDAALRWQAEIAKLPGRSEARQAEKEIVRLEVLKAEWGTEAGRKRITYEQTIARGQVLVRAQDYPAAMKEAKAALAIDDSRFEAHALVANIELHAGREAEALPALVQAMEKMPPGSNDELVAARWRLENKVKAQELVRAAREKLAAGEKDEAAALFQQAFSNDGNQVTMDLVVARELVAMGRADLAIPMYKFVESGLGPEAAAAKAQLAAIQDAADDEKALAALNGQKTQAEKELAGRQASYDRLARSVQTAVKNRAETADMVKRAAAYASGEGVAQDDAAAAQLWLKAAERGDARAAFEIGRAYHLGRGIAKNSGSAAGWWQKAVERGNADAVPFLAAVYHEGRGLAANEAKAVELWQKAAAAGDATSAYELGNAYADGRIVARNETTAVTWWRKAADREIPGAMFRLGQAYYNGRGVARNVATGIKWLTAAAKKGVTDAATVKLLADAYFSGKNGVAGDPAEAGVWLLQAAKNGDVDSMARIGAALWEGNGVNQDREQAVTWWKKAGNLGNANALALTGAAYAMGEGVPKDMATAVSWYRRAAERGNAKAMMELAGAYNDGDGVPQNYATAFSWYRRAGEAGDIDGMMATATSYQDGQGVKKSLPDAILWWKRAARAGNHDAQEELRVRKVSW